MAVRSTDIQDGMDLTDQQGTIVLRQKAFNFRFGSCVTNAPSEYRRRPAVRTMTSRGIDRKEARQPRYDATKAVTANGS